MGQRIGVVLAGGEGRRMGGPKGSLVHEGIPLAERAARTLWPVCGSVLISIAHGMANPAPSFEEVEDDPPAGRGPLAGILAAFRATGAADLIVLACDYPHMDPRLLVAIAELAREEDEIVFPTDPAGRDHPLVALWRRSTESLVERALQERSYRVRRLLAELRTRRLGPDELGEIDLGRSLANWNVPDDQDRF